jgi:hypothetical protein
MTTETPFTTTRIENFFIFFAVPFHHYKEINHKNDSFSLVKVLNFGGVVQIFIGMPSAPQKLLISDSFFYQ